MSIRHTKLWSSWATTHERALRCSLAGHIRRPVLRDAWMWKAEGQEFDPVPLRGWDRPPSEHFHKEPSERSMVNGYRPERRQRQVDYIRTRIPSASLIVRADDLTFIVNARRDIGFRIQLGNVLNPLEGISLTLSVLHV